MNTKNIFNKGMEKLGTWWIILTPFHYFTVVHQIFKLISWELLFKK